MILLTSTSLTSNPHAGRSINNMNMLESPSNTQDKDPHGRHLTNNTGNQVQQAIDQVKLTAPINITPILQ